MTLLLLCQLAVWIDCGGSRQLKGRFSHVFYNLSKATPGLMYFVGNRGIRRSGSRY